MSSSSSRLGFLLALASLAPWCAGCALKYQDARGHVHIVGFTAVTLAPEGPAREATRVETRNVGLMVYSSAASRGVSIGYNREEVIYPTPFPPRVD